MSARFYRNPMGRGFAGGLPCQAPSEGDQPFASSPFAHPIPQTAVARAQICSAALDARRTPTAFLLYRCILHALQANELKVGVTPGFAGCAGSVGWRGRPVITLRSGR